ncbi:MAG TPA: HD family hydrolase [Parvularculaceae bacterium]|nr:HD family hydrolase [Parvularculaceae bacterium]
MGEKSKAPGKQSETSPRAWQRMLSGRRLDLLDPSPLDIEIEDIAHGLARVARWNGQTLGPLPFTVAQHSLLVEEFCTKMKPGWPAKWRLAALLHDGPEFVIGDMISPFKAQLGGQYKALEKRLQRAIHLRFSLPADLPEAVEKTIKRADRASAFFEATQLAGFDHVEARRFFGAPRGLLPPTLKAAPTSVVEARYLARFTALADVVAPTAPGQKKTG